MPRMMTHPHTRGPGVTPRPISPMVYRLRRQTPNAGYAEIEVVSHPGSHHSPGDVILIDWDEYERGKFVHPPNVGTPPPPVARPETENQSQAIADFLALNPHIHNMANSIPPKRSKANDTRRKSKSKNQRPLKRL